MDNRTPRLDVQLLFDEIGIALDRDQYRDVLSLLDMYHVYLRQHQVRFQHIQHEYTPDCITVSQI